MSFFFGLISGAISVFWGLHKFYKEKWWDKQFSAFLDIVEHLNTIRLCVNFFEYEFEKAINPDQSYMQSIYSSGEISQKLENANKALEETLGRVDFLLGREVSTLLEEYINAVTFLESKYLHDFYDENDVHSLYQEQASLIESASNNIISISKSTLRRDSIISGLFGKFWSLKYPKKFKIWCLNNEPSETRR